MNVAREMHFQSEDEKWMMNNTRQWGWDEGKQPDMMNSLRVRPVIDRIERG